MIEIERIIVDDDEKEAFKFVKKFIYDRILHSQQSRLKSHLDGTNPVEEFIKHNE
ncbi:hypothetical protein ACFLTT_02150 [Chloroflexota bacterium]